MNENEFVDYLKNAFPFSYGVGIGDDTSVVKMGEYYQLITKDVLIEDVHFTLDRISLEDLALKSLAVNVSDIAAMGGIPQYFYLGLGFPRSIPKEKTLEFFKGMEMGCRKWNVQLAGGDYSGSEKMFISITLVGTAKNPIYRNGARENDLIGITGPVGESALGLKLLSDGRTEGYFIDKHIHVEPEIEKGVFLSNYANSMIDISDGLLLDLNRVLRASGKNARIVYENIPGTAEIKEACDEFGWNEYEIVLSGGEDYKLLFTMSRENEARLKKECPDFQHYIIGEVDAATDKTGEISVNHHGQPITVSQLGYDHFSVNK